MPILLAETDEDILMCYKVMRQLRPHLTEDIFMNKIKHLQEKYGYRLLAFIENGEAKAAAGFRICESLAWGKYLYVDDLITDEENRSKGMQFVYLTGWRKNSNGSIAPLCI